MELLDYLHTHLPTRAQLLADSGTGAARLDALTDRGAMPQPSYRLELGVRCDSLFGARGGKATRVPRQGVSVPTAPAPRSPHERARSTRQRYVDAMRRQYALPAP